MKSVNRLSALGLALAVGVTACDDSSTGPGADGPFNPTSSAADLQVVEDAFDTPVFASLGSMSGNFSRIQGAPALASVLSDAGWDLVTAGESWQLKAAGERVTAALYSAAAAEVVLIPDGFRGRTYDYHPEEGYYYDEARTGAPANGMRFILYEVNPVTHEPGATEIGYVDLLDESTDLAGVARIVVVSGDTQFINYTVSAAALVGSITFAVDGFVSDGTDIVNVNLTTSFASTFATQTVNFTYRIDIPSRDFTMSATMVMEFSGETEQGTVTVDVQFQQSSHSVQIQGSFTLGENESGSLNVLVNGDLFATIAISGETLTIADGSGAALSAEQAQALENIMDSFEGLFGDRFEDFLRPVSWLFQLG